MRMLRRGRLAAPSRSAILELLSAASVIECPGRASGTPLPIQWIQTCPGKQERCVTFRFSSLTNGHRPSAESGHAGTRPVPSRPDAAPVAGDVDVRAVWARPDPVRLFRLAEDVRDGKLRIPIARRMRLSEIREAHEAAEKGVWGKIG